MREHRASATDPTPGYRRRRADAIVALVAVAVLAVAFLVMGRVDRVPQVERDVFHAINDLPGWLGALVEPVMQLGWYGAVLIVAAAAIVVGFLSRHPRRGAALGLAVGLAGTGAYLAARLAKHVVDRGRPGSMLEEVRIRGAAASGLGFPSGHSAVAAAIVLVVIPYLIWRWRWVLLALPLIVAFARIYVGAHLPLDVVAGLGIGAICASVMNLAIGVPPVPHREPVEPRAGGATGEEDDEPVPPPREAPLGAPR
jgi:glycosyltransferase 2 family protein